MLLAWRLTLAHHLDWWEQRLRRIGEKLGWPQAWLHEFIAYRGDPRMTIEEFWVRYVLLRMDAEEKWFQPKMSDEEARRFYEKHDYQSWRNLVHRRHSAWRRVALTMRGEHGAMLEYGCGVGPVTHYCARWGWHFGLVDLDGPARRFAMRRSERRPHAALSAFEKFEHLEPVYDVVTALDVFEHLPYPEWAAKQLVFRLNPGGYLHYNIHKNPSANDLDLATGEQLDATERYLESVLDIVWRKNEYRVGRKR